MPAGRPKVYDESDVLDSLVDYIDANKAPMIQEFCLEYGFTKDTLYRLAENNSEITDAIKRCHAKREIYIVRQTEQGNINPTFSIFQLKQKCFGWTDKQEIESNNTNTNLNKDISNMSLEEIQAELAEKFGYNITKKP